MNHEAMRLVLRLRGRARTRVTHVHGPRAARQASVSVQAHKEAEHGGEKAGTQASRHAWHHRGGIAVAFCTC
eukprot:37899-Alexandrium_andersonii.AAC.1